MPPARRLQPGAGEGPCPRRFGSREGRCVASRAGEIVAEILQFGNGKAGPDHAFTEVLPVDDDCRDGPPIRAARPEADPCGFGAQGIRGEILRSLATFPAARNILTELVALERIDAEQAEVHGHCIAVESAGLGVEGL